MTQFGLGRQIDPILSQTGPECKPNANQASMTQIHNPLGSEGRPNQFGQGDPIWIRSTNRPILTQTGPECGPDPNQVSMTKIRDPFGSEGEPGPVWAR